MYIPYVHRRYKTMEEKCDCNLADKKRIGNTGISVVPKRLKQSCRLFFYLGCFVTLKSSTSQLTGIKIIAHTLKGQDLSNVGRVERLEGNVISP